MQYILYKCKIYFTFLEDVYKRQIIESLVASGEGPALLEVLGALIQHLVVDQLHLIGDVYDRGPAPQLIMDELLSYPNVDVYKRQAWRSAPSTSRL